VTWTVPEVAPAAADPEQADLVARMRKAPPLRVENLGAPVRTTGGGNIEWVPNPDGKSYDLLIRYYNTYWGPHTTVIVDLATGEVKQHLRPSALYSGATIGPDGKYYSTLTGKGGTAIQVYDPASNSVSDLPEVAKDVNGETKPLSIGPDGMLYGAGSSKSRAIVYQLDPKTGKITNYGHVGPSHAPNDCWGYSVAADGRCVYVASGKLPWHLVAYDKETKKDTVLLTLDDARGYLHVDQRRDGCEAGTQTEKGESKRYWLLHGKLIEKKQPNEPPPWPPRADAKPWVVMPPRPDLGTAKLLPKSDGKAELWYLPVEARQKLPKDLPADADPLALGWKVVRFEVPTYPYPIHRVIALPDGRVCGSGGNYLGNFIWDPKTNAAEHKGILRLSHYSSTVAEGKVYMSGYPSSALYVYDPDKPWTANDAAKPWTNPLPEDSPASNPRRLTYLAHDGSGCHKMLAAVTGADGKVYFGGRWYRNGEGGGLGWWDIQAAKGGGISLPFRCYQVHHMTTACDGRIIVVSTKAVRDAVGGQPEPDEARLFIFDTVTMAIAREIVPVKGAKMTGPVAGVGGPFVLGLTYNPADREGAKEERFPLSYGYADKSSILYKVNVETGDVVWRKTLPYPVGFHMNENATRQDGFDFRLGPDGKVWTYTGGKFVPVNPKHGWHYSYLGKDLCLVRIEPADGRIEVVGQLDRAGEMAFSGRDLILSGGCKYLDPLNTHLRRVRNVVPHPRPWSLAPNLGVTWYCPRIAKRPTVVPRSACPTVLLPQPARRAPALLVKPAVAHPRWVLEQPQEQQ
jgi:hypothetical protein